MKLSINMDAILQYIVLYLMLITHGSGLLLAMGDRWPYIYILISGLIIIWYKQTSHQRIILFTIIIVCSIMLTRITVGGVGISIISTILARTLIGYSAVILNKKACATRFVRLSTFLSLGSLICFILLNINRKLLAILLPFRVSAGFGVYFLYNPIFTNNELGAGDFVLRNNGLYTEPTLMAIQALCALYILFLVPDLLDINEKERKKHVIITIITLLTTLSTTGYTTVLICIVIFVLKGKYPIKIKRNICITVFIIACVAYLEYYQNGKNGLIGYFFLRKLVGSNAVGEAVIDFGAAGTGEARISVILSALALLPRYPFGCGYDIFGNYIRTHSIMGEASSGGGFMSELAVLGLIPMVTVIAYLYKGVRRLSSQFSAVVIFFVIWIVTTMAESTVFYPVFFMIATIGFCNNCNVYKKGKDYQNEYYRQI